MAYRTNFTRDLAKAKKSEQYVADKLKELGWGIEDVSDNPDYWSKDVDLIATKDEDSRKVEIKADNYIDTTGNLNLELSNITRGNAGWFNFTQADFLAVYANQTEDIYIFPLVEVRKYVAEFGSSCRSYSSADPISNGTVNLYKNLLVNIEDYCGKGFPLQMIRKEVHEWN